MTALHLDSWLECSTVRNNQVQTQQHNELGKYTDPDSNMLTIRSLQTPLTNAQVVFWWFSTQQAALSNHSSDQNTL